VKRFSLLREKMRSAGCSISLANVRGEDNGGSFPAETKLTCLDFHGGHGESARLALSIAGIQFEMIACRLRTRRSVPSDA